jgi:molecular chaperone GrpE
MDAQEGQAPVDSELRQDNDEDFAGSQVGGTPDHEAEALRREVGELKDRLLRSAADYQNYVRRAQQNVADAREQQLLEVAKALVNVLDHFDRALEVDPAKTTTQGLLQGVQIVRDELFKLLEKFGLKRIVATPGQDFDPLRHEALMRQPAKGIPPDHVAAQLQPGYVLGERTVRPAKVALAQ